MSVLCAGLVLLFASLAAPSAHAEFGLHDLDVTFTNADGSPAMQAGSHPFQFTTQLALNTVEEEGGTYPDGALRDLTVKQAAGLVADRGAVPTCSTADFLTDSGKACPNSSALGLTRVSLGNNGKSLRAGPFPVYSLEPPPGAVAKLGFWVTTVPQTVLIGVETDRPHRGEATLRNVPQILEVFDSDVTLWGNPADPAHDPFRGTCLRAPSIESEQPPSLSHEDLLAFQDKISEGDCPANVPQRPFLTLPRSCNGPLQTVFQATSWWQGDPLAPQPGGSFEGSVATHDDSIPPQPLGTTGCAKLAFSPQIKAQPTTLAAQSPTGLDFAIDVTDEGLTNSAGIAGADISRVEVTLPEGLTTNPSIAEGLEVCTEAQLAAVSLDAPPSSGCPDASKIGTLEVESPLLEGQLIGGSLHIAKPYDNPFGSLLALYMVIRSEELGILVKQPLEVRPDPQTGRLTTIADDLPQLPFSSFRLRFREGARSPLASPPACGNHEVKALLTPSSGAPPITATSAFQIISGPNGGPCPAGGLPPFKPGLLAGTLNNAAGRFSDFYLRLTRNDGEQEFTRFSIKLPPGIAGILAGIPHCPDSAIEAAKHRTATEELANPSCPAASEVGRSLAGAGVGPALAYAPGKIYLAGPYNGSPISIAAITAAKVGPFDVGTVVIRQGFQIDPRTAEVFLDATGSDPIPHIINGIPVHARDIRAYVDRPNFVFNPTSCRRTSTASTVLGSGLDFASAADDNPLVVSTPFQAADCAALAFKPKLKFRLKGGTKRGAHPSLRAHVSAGMLGKDANIAKARVTLPKSEFLENAHIGTVCTRVQYAKDACPADSIYGYATAVTPILAQPLAGPIYLRSSENKLPDLVAAFRSAEGIKFDLVGRIDSVKGGGIRNTFDIVPDAPVTSADFVFFGAKKGLLVNSTNVCKGKHRVKVELTAHNGRRATYKTPLEAKCGKKGKKKSRAKGGSRRGNVQR